MASARGPLLVALALAACAPWRSAARPWQHADAEIRAWVEGSAISLASAAGDLDLTPLCDAVAGRPIVALGESSHGVHELKLAQLAVIRCLAARPAPLTVLFELSYDFAGELDAYVQGTAPLPDLGGGLVGTDELRASLDWIRAHNLRSHADARVRIGGLDIFCWYECVAEVVDTLALVDPAHAAGAERRLAPVRAPWPDLVADAGARARAALEQEKALLLARRDAFVAAGQRARWDDASHRLDLALAQASDAFDGFPRAHDRDRVMADNVGWFRAAARPGEVLLLVAHSGHVAADAQHLPNGRRSPPSMGEHLRHHHGADYVPVNMTFPSGSFLAHRANRLAGQTAGHENPTAVFAVADPPSGTFEEMLRGPRGPFVLDLRRLPAHGPVAAWFGWEQHVRSLGAAWRESFDRWPFEEVGWTRLIPARAFDLVVHLPEATPLVPL